MLDKKDIEPSPSPGSAKGGGKDSKLCFVADEVSGIVKQTIENAIGGQVYTNAKVSQWTSEVVEECLVALTNLQKPFKYIVNCTIMQKSSGSGLHTASSCLWDNESDGCCTVKWENKTLYCIVSVFGLAL